MLAVTFDYGQTLAELDTEFLSRRAAERGVSVERTRLDAVESVAWGAYEDAKRAGLSGYDAWKTFMFTLLSKAGATAASPSNAEGDSDERVVASLVDYLWSEQPTKNLWRRPIAGMTELLTDLAGSGVPLGIVSNSEGRLAELVREMGWAHFFAVIADSGKLGFEKPDRRIFEYAAERLGAAPSELIHVGDVWAADVDGALAVGARAIWVTRKPTGTPLPNGVAAASSAEDIRRELIAFGVPAGNIK